jgi:nucleoside-diphosphate-sugar epimerase
MAIHRLCEAALGRATFPRYGDGSAVREFTYVSDIVAGNLAAAAADVAPGTYVNLAGGAEIVLRDLIALVEELAGRSIAVEQHDTMPGDSKRNGGAIDRATELLGWVPEVPLRDGIAAQLAWHTEMRR